MRRKERGCNRTVSINFQHLFLTCNLQWYCADVFYCPRRFFCGDIATKWGAKVECNDLLLFVNSAAKAMPKKDRVLYWHGIVEKERWRKRGNDLLMSLGFRVSNTVWNFLFLKAHHVGIVGGQNLFPGQEPHWWLSSIPSVTFSPAILRSTSEGA